MNATVSLFSRLTGHAAKAILTVFAALLLGPPSLSLAQNEKAIPAARKAPAESTTARVLAGKGVPPDASKRINQFFAALRQKQIKTAYDLLIGDSELSKSQKTVNDLHESTSKLLVSYGVFQGHEVLRSKAVGSRLIRVEAAAYAKSQPFQWTFFFYKSKSTWKVIDIQVNADVKEMFGEE